MKKFGKITLFFAVVVTAFALVMTCNAAITAATENNSAFEIVMAVITLVAGGYAVYKASRATMEDLNR